MAARTVSTPAAEPARTPSLRATGVIAVVTAQSMPQQIDVGRGLAGLGASRDQDVEAGGDRGLQEARGVGSDRAQGHELVEAVRLQDELADVDRHVPPGDVRDDSGVPSCTASAAAELLRLGAVQRLKRRGAKPVT